LGLFITGHLEADETWLTWKKLRKIQSGMDGPLFPFVDWDYTPFDGPDSAAAIPRKIVDISFDVRT
jgi:hypothetical protein